MFNIKIHRFQTKAGKHRETQFFLQDFESPGLFLLVGVFIFHFIKNHT
jgi:hypothetical protein